MIDIKAGMFFMGDAFEEGYLLDKEGPQVPVLIPSFSMAETPVTNQEFATFIEETGYVTEAEQFGWSMVFHLLVDEGDRAKYQKNPKFPWWLMVYGASWDHPEGPESTIGGRLDHPVVHVSRNDALAYCDWAGLRLPSEAEWEYAARAGSETRYPWGQDLVEGGRYHANTWQGDFPNENSLADGYLGTAPVKEYEANSFGLYQMIGNVWELCSNPAKMDLSDFTHTNGKVLWQKYKVFDQDVYAIRGGSFLCHHSYCNRYRVSARNKSVANSSSSNCGFRCVKDF